MIEAKPLLVFDNRVAGKAKPFRSVLRQPQDASTLFLLHLRYKLHLNHLPFWLS